MRRKYTKTQYRLHYTVQFGKYSGEMNIQQLIVHDPLYLLSFIEDKIITLSDDAYNMLAAILKQYFKKDISKQ
jgi:hypothetical protein